MGRLRRRRTTDWTLRRVWCSRRLNTGSTFVWSDTAVRNDPRAPKEVGGRDVPLGLVLGHGQPVSYSLEVVSSVGIRTSVKGQREPM